MRAIVLGAMVRVGGPSMGSSKVQLEALNIGVKIVGREEWHL